MRRRIEILKKLEIRLLYRWIIRITNILLVNWCKIINSLQNLKTQPKSKKEKNIL